MCRCPKRESKNVQSESMAEVASLSDVSPNTPKADEANLYYFGNPAISLSNSNNVESLVGEVDSLAMDLNKI